MYIVENKSKQGKAIYRSILLSQSYREGGKVKRRTIANLSHCTPGEIAAIRLALRHKENLSVLGSLTESVELEEGPSVGAVWVVYQMAKRLGIEKALGLGREGKLGLWQVIARVIEQGSRLSAVRLAQRHAVCEILGIERAFHEDHLYANLSWLSDHQKQIENDLFWSRRGTKKPELFLYDVTSSYLEGENNAYGAYGYNRDGKKRKKQIVIGLLCDEEGVPVSTEVFAGNTSDMKTFGAQVKKVVDRFGSERVTVVGDRGMIKTTQIQELPEGVHYITAITKPQIETLMRRGIIQIGLFDDPLCEVLDQEVRYILRRNPSRAAEMAKTREEKYRRIEEEMTRKNAYLLEHEKAHVSIALRDVERKIARFGLGSWVKAWEQGRALNLQVNEEARTEEALLDGCYVLKTDLGKDVAGKQMIHDRYKDLALVEQAFRDSKTNLLEVRPVHVRTKEHTDLSACILAQAGGHVLVVMLAYMIIRELRKAWSECDLTVEEGLRGLSTLCAMKMKVKGQGECFRIPQPRALSGQLLKALDISLPDVLPNRKVNVVTRKKLQKRRKRLKN